MMQLKFLRRKLNRIPPNYPPFLKYYFYQTNNFKKGFKTSCDPIVPTVKNTLTNEIETISVPNKTLNWYCCGPTVYDSAHLGHARTYVCFDIIRRILETQFGKGIFFCLGMTDIDDKIIKRGWERGLAGKPWQEYAALARHFEQEFMEDMATLNVLRPHAITRVSEHMEDIVAYISKILKNGNGYVVKSSGVYFDVRSLGTSYGRLVSGKGNAIEADGEAVALVPGKRDQRDFALWKAAKKNEPFWDSPWGGGRPGWHIECSAMTHALFGNSLDIHSGGIDLAFPHHTNEMAQCEAHNCSPDWVKYWIHSGHLHISGLKMSKSLKNFITVREFLESSSPDAFRMFCLQYKYNTNISFSNDRLEEAQMRLTRFNQLLSLSWLHLADLHDASSSMHGTKRWEDADHQLFQKYIEIKALVKRDLGNDFDTPSVLNRLDQLMSLVHEHLKHGDKRKIPPEPVEAALNYISEMLGSFGLSQISHPQTIQVQEHSSASAVMDVLASFRSEVRSSALQIPNDRSSKSRLLSLCDEVRDRDLPGIGIELEDISNHRSHWKFISPVKATATDQKSENKMKNQGKPHTKKINKADMVIPSEMFKHGEYKDRFGAFDDQGIPTHDENMQPLSKTGIKKLKKKFEKSVKRYTKFKTV